MMISAETSSERRECARDLGADAFLPKPPDFTVLKDKLYDLGQTPDGGSDSQEQDL